MSEKAPVPASSEQISTLNQLAKLALRHSKIENGRKKEVEFPLPDNRKSTGLGAADFRLRISQLHDENDGTISITFYHPHLPHPDADLTLYDEDSPYKYRYQGLREFDTPIAPRGVSFRQMLTSEVAQKFIEAIDEAAELHHTTDRSHQESIHNS
jgi:hypothetical protein